MNRNPETAISGGTVQIVAAIISAAVPNDGGRGWTSFVLLIIELNLICIVGWSSERNAGNAVKELEVTACKQGSYSKGLGRSTWCSCTTVYDICCISVQTQLESNA